MQCSGVGAMLCPLYNVPVLFRCLGIYGGFCNVRVLMQCSVVDGMFVCWCNVPTFMQCLDVDAMFEC